jgi:hypothetical protein
VAKQIAGCDHWLGECCLTEITKLCGVVMTEDKRQIRLILCSRSTIDSPQSHAAVDVSMQRIAHSRIVYNTFYKFSKCLSYVNEINDQKCNYRIPG